MFYWNYYANLALVGLLFTVSVWNGANFYIDVFSKKYLKGVMKRQNNRPHQGHGNEGNKEKDKEEEKLTANTASVSGNAPAAAGDDETKRGRHDAVATASAVGGAASVGPPSRDMVNIPMDATVTDVSDHHSL